MLTSPETAPVADPPASDAILQVAGLTITAAGGGQPVTLVRDLSFSIAKGETLGIVGESGSGKTVTALSVGGLLPRGLLITGGQVWFDSEDLVAATPQALRSIRGSKIGFVFQDPQNSLDPVFTVGDQLSEAIRAHRRMSRKQAREVGVGLLDRVGIAQAAKRMGDYPHQFSGGMAQRVMLAIALCCNPELLIADEPTTSLDVTTQAQILDLLDSLKAEFALSMLLISHDLGVVAELADRVAVMYAGQIVEEGATEELFHRPHHPYLDALIATQPEEGARGHQLATIPGSVPSMNRMPSGCRFHPRCSFAAEACRVSAVALETVGVSGRSVRCIRSGELDLKGMGGRPPEGSGVAAPVAAPVRITRAGVPSDAEAVLEVKDLTKDFGGKGSLLGRSRYVVKAVDNVSFAIRAGETLGLVGETGAGKSTVGRLVLGLERPSAGTVSFRGEPLGPVDKRPKSVHRDMQVIFQNPYASLNPAMAVVDLVAEPIDIHGRLPKTKREAAVVELLGSVGLGREYLRRYVYELSGGQLQRVAIARALSVNPKLIVLDEPTTALDVSSQAQVVNLLQDLQDTHGMSYLFIGHNLAVVSHASDRLAILYAGQVMELGDSESVYRWPRHPYTQALIGAILSIDPAKRRTGHRAVAPHGVAEAVSANGATSAGPAVRQSVDSLDRQGCVYAPRCPLAREICWKEIPPDVGFEDGTLVRCHFAEEAASLTAAATSERVEGRP